jgi:hypothetical protein
LHRRISLVEGFNAELVKEGRGTQTSSVDPLAYERFLALYNRLRHSPDRTGYKEYRQDVIGAPSSAVQRDVLEALGLADHRADRDHQDATSRCSTLHSQRGSWIDVNRATRASSMAFPSVGKGRALAGQPAEIEPADLMRQGSRMSVADDELEHVVVVPGGLLAPAA